MLQLCSTYRRYIISLLANLNARSSRPMPHPGFRGFDDDSPHHLTALAFNPILSQQRVNGLEEEDRFS
jgi:hypothetical protein